MIKISEIEKLMRQRGWNQSTLADKCNVSQGTVSRWLKGTTPDPAAQAILSELLKSEDIETASFSSTANPDLNRVFELVLESYLYIGLDQNEAVELLNLVREAASKPSEKPANVDAKNYQNTLAATAIQRFLHLKPPRSHKS